MSPEAYIRRMRELAIERYRLVEVPGRPEELVRVVADSTASQLGVSFAYAGGTIRVRPMVGRKWVDEEITDFRLASGWKDRFFRLLDRHFGYQPVMSGPIPKPPYLPRSPEELSSHPLHLRRPIRDNPQA